MINVKDFKEIEEKLKAASGKPEYDELNQKLTGPDTGIWFDEDEKVIKIAEDWTTDKDGNVVRCSEFGPGVENGNK